MERESGYYWVKLGASSDFGYESAEWINECGFWQRTGIENDYVDSDFAEIDERRIVRGEVFPVSSISTIAPTDLRIREKAEEFSTDFLDDPHAIAESSFIGGANWMKAMLVMDEIKA
jgi:hypothetical protein